jgi:hypothetical protein
VSKKRRGETMPEKPRVIDHGACSFVMHPDDIARGASRLPQFQRNMVALRFEVQPPAVELEVTVERKGVIEVEIDLGKTNGVVFRGDVSK